jgi:hypothetical protein
MVLNIDYGLAIQCGNHGSIGCTRPREGLNSSQA